MNTIHYSIPEGCLAIVRVDGNKTSLVKTMRIESGQYDHGPLIKQAFERLRNHYGIIRTSVPDGFYALMVEACEAYGTDQQCADPCDHCTDGHIHTLRPLTECDETFAPRFSVAAASECVLCNKGIRVSGGGAEWRCPDCQDGTVPQKVEVVR